MTDEEEQKFVQGIYDSLFASLTTSEPGGGPALYDPEKTFFCIQQKGMIISESDFGNPYDPATNTGGNQRALANLVDLANAVPNLSAIYAPNGNTVDELYEDYVLNSTITATVPADPAEKKRVDAAYKLLNDEKGNPTKIVLDNMKAKKDWQTAKTALSAKFWEMQATPEGRAKWPTVGPDYVDAAKDTYSIYRSTHLIEIENARATINGASRNQVAIAFDKANTLWANSEITIGGKNIHVVRCLPSDWAEDTAGGNWNSFTFSSSQIATSSHSDFTSYGGGGGFSVGLWSVGGDAQHSVKHQHTEADGKTLEVDFKWSYVEIFRPFLNFSLLGAPGWKTNLTAKGKLSSGSRSNQSDTKFPLMVTGFIAIRNLTIKAGWTHNDQTIVDSTTSGRVSVGYGPFSVSGSYSHSEHNEFSHAQKAGGGITNPAVQIVGWIAQIVPFSPPE